MEEWEGSSEGVEGRRWAWMALTKADTSGRLLEKLEPDAVEKKRRFDASGGLWEASGRSSTRRGAGGALDAAEGCGSAILDAKPFAEGFENRRRRGGVC